MPESPSAVPVVHAPAPGPVTARLMLGVGTCDEPVRLAGITHLVEHLAVRGALPIAAPHNAVTDDWVTVFEVTATTTDEALDLLTRFGASIGALVDVPDADVDRERKILAAEDRFRYAEQVPSLHTARFGPTGPGRAGAGAAATHSLTADEVRDWVRQWFVAENAVVGIVGGTDAPEHLVTGLPAGRAAGPLPWWTGPTKGGRLRTSGVGGVAASVVVPRTTAMLLEAVVEHEVFDDVRIRAGLSYAIDAHSLDVDTETAVVGIVVDPAEDDVVATIETLTATLHRIADHGPAPATLARIEAVRTLNLVDATVRADIEVSSAALGRLRGLGVPPFGLAVPEAEVTALRDALRRALPDLLVCVDEDLDVELDDVAARVGLTFEAPTAGQPLHQVGPLGRPTGATHRDALLPAWASVRVRLHGSKLVLLPRGGEDRVIDLSTAAVVGVRGDEGITVVDAAGSLFQIRADEWWRGSRLIDEVRAATPPHLVRGFTT